MWQWSRPQSRMWGLGGVPATRRPTREHHSSRGGARHWHRRGVSGDCCGLSAGFLLGHVARQRDHNSDYIALGGHHHANDQRDGERVHHGLGEPRGHDNAPARADHRRDGPDRAGADRRLATAVEEVDREGANFPGRIRLGRSGAMSAEMEDLTDVSNDPVAQLLLRGRAETLREAEELYLDSCLPEVLRLLRSGLSDEELGRHPLMRMLRSHGSRGWEEAVD